MRAAGGFPMPEWLGCLGLGGGPEEFENDCAAGTYGGWRHDRWGLPALSRWGEESWFAGWFAWHVMCLWGPRHARCIASAPAIATSEI
ncbi:hypothetical protein SETIT_9G432500v2 [Setaria italica]|uniref:Uncharacterized protein n=1 Tax=Setaria italica TaxID=4555 RepID=A0A368SRZ1_SETIT|nr:hypothetical protein SETIT_9G432500v2 [Setaria italica]